MDNRLRILQLDEIILTLVMIIKGFMRIYLVNNYKKAIVRIELTILIAINR
jgi:hypothetical protein